MRKLAFVLSLLLAGCGGINIPDPSPTPAPSPTPTPSPLPPPGGGVQQFGRHPQWPQCFQMNGQPYTILGFGNVVTAVPGHSWESDVDFLGQTHCNYARLWDKLMGDTPPNMLPWLRLANGKFDLEQKNPAYWSLMDQVAETTRASGIILEVMVFDRGCGGGNADYAVCPWNPRNNVNGLSGELPDAGLGTPQLYEAGLKAGSKTAKLQELYVTWYAEFASRHVNILLEVENENRSDDANQARDWAQKWARVIKRVSPSTQTSFSTLNEEGLTKIYNVVEVDAVSKHYGNEGDSTDVFHAYCHQNWSKKHVVNFDEFYNGMNDPMLLRNIMQTIAEDGCMGHIEDAGPGANAADAAGKARQFVAGKNPPPCATGPTGPAPQCPKEDHRGAAFYRADWKDGSCVGNTDCSKQNGKGGGFPKGAKIAFDSTAKDAANHPIPDGCPVQVPTVWTITPKLAMTSQDFSMQAKFPAPGTYLVCSKGAAKAVCLAVKVK